MCDKIQSGKLRKTTFTAELVKVCSTILVNSIENNDEDFIKMYFEYSKRSGGGAVESVCLLGNDKATVTFKDHKGNSVLCSLCTWIQEF